MTPEEKLNFILRFFTTLSGRAASAGDLSSRFSKNEIRDDAELTQILDKLESDEYLSSPGMVEKYDLSHTTKFYYLTFTGEMFIKNDGYVQQKKDSNRIRLRDNVNIWAISVGAITAAVYYSIEIGKYLVSLNWIHC